MFKTKKVCKKVQPISKIQQKMKTIGHPRLTSGDVCTLKPENKIYANEVWILLTDLLYHFF